MKTSLLILLIFLPFLAQSQVTVFTKGGRPILIYGDGTWKYGNVDEALQKQPIQSSLIKQETDINMRLDKFHKRHSLGAGLGIAGFALGFFGVEILFTKNLFKN